MKRQDTLKLSTLLLGLMILLPVALTACVSAVPEEEIQPEVVAPVVEEVQVITEDELVSDSANLAENPELMVAGRYEGAENEVVSGSAFYAANPELLAADRYTVSVTKNRDMSDSEFFAANPEMMAAHRYTAVATEK